MSLPLCSILTPLFNEEKNIKSCFHSLLMQTYENIEIIFIDDGSTDNSSLIIDEIIRENSKLKIKKLYQKNSGAAKARELGLLNAEGDYVAFLDCDDVLSNDAIESAMNYFLTGNNSIDISLFRLKFVYNDKEDCHFFDIYKETEYLTGKDAFENSIEKWGVHGLGIYRKKILTQAYSTYYKYNKGIENNINNDEVITRMALFLSRKISLSEGIYYYIDNSESTTRKKNLNIYKKISNVIVLYDFILKEDPEKRENIKKAKALLSDTIWDTLKIYSAWKNEIKEKKSWHEEIKKGVSLFFSTSVFYNNKERKFKRIIRMIRTIILIMK
ncbi:glycosyltransferase family 2 protein [Pectobacterium punjabense]|uniref:glycosyltransferase n=1 Tax=Pectobacterium punjabense TaxID=2108399 RepID=UPI001BFF74EC|nr:glycosyltransferase family 2 protein [Pectobacterium punjabense]MBT9182784.1 glycosyltransferase family 2 protein [Pectobacterium punjabense]